MNSDWFPSMPNMLTVLGMSAPPHMPPPAAAMPQQAPAKSSSFLKYFPSGGFYKGSTAPSHGVAASLGSSASHAQTPLLGVQQHQLHHRSNVATLHAPKPLVAVHHHNHPNQGTYSASHSVAARRMRAVPHLTDAWNAFDAVAPAQSSESRADLEPIGPKVSSLRSSVWQLEATLRPFSVWGSPTLSLSNVLGRVASPTQKKHIDEEDEEAAATEKTFHGSTIDSDDEDWMEHLQYTLEKVMKVDEATHAAMGGNSATSQQPQCGSYHAFSGAEMQWA